MPKTCLCEVVSSTLSRVKNDGTFQNLTINLNIECKGPFLYSDRKHKIVKNIP